MTVAVARHGAPGLHAAEYADQLGEWVTSDIEELEQSSEMIDSTFGTALLHMEARCTVDPGANELETWEAVVNAMQLGSAMFAVSGVSDGTAECRVNLK
ncbi:hypothetical protein ACFYWY_14650 [Streptomyces sp. NPDC002870]|uniref:hypothetical protein n=1 Tax=Streptomyces sp. NPDC002870 TaxID=3364666 RepID=UPI00367E05E8